MRYILLVMMMAGMLFSAQQRQIIVGSFSIESNALFYSLDMQKHIDKDAELNALMDKYSLKVEYKEVGAYHVVRIAPFNDYPSLFETIDKLKKYYPKAYAINYPAFPGKLAKPVALVEESVVEEEPEPILQVEPEEVEAVKPEEVTPVAVEKEIKYVAPVAKKPVPLPIPKAEVSEGALSMDDMLLLVVLLLAIIGFVIYKKKMKKEEE